MDLRKGIVEVRELPKEEKVYLKESVLGWKVVKPIQNEDGTFNWFNFLTGGSWANLIISILIVAIICLALYEYVSNMKLLLDCFTEPVKLEACKQSFGYTNSWLP